MSRRTEDSLEGMWACPICGWTVVSDQPLEEQSRLVADGWWWCAQGHDRVAVVWKETVNA